MGNMSDLVIGEPGYLIALQSATDISRDESGRVYAWRSGENIAKFKTIPEFIDYVGKHIAELDPETTVAVSGSSSTLAFAQSWLQQEFSNKALKEALNGR
jgi:hypothetical protein